MQNSVLVVDDQKEFATFLVRLLTKLNYKTTLALSASECFARMEELYPDVVLMDLNLPDGNGSELVSNLKIKYPNTQFIILTGYGSIQSAMESAHRGAIDYLTKPCESKDIILAIKKAVRKHKLNMEAKSNLNNAQYSTQKTNFNKNYKAPFMKQVFAIASRAANQNGTVLFLGDSGSGKEFLARWIHNNSIRRDSPFFTINCSALTKDIAELELFGHESGAFTETQDRKKGLLERASKGTLLLKEIGALNLALQAKLLTALDTKSFLRVGGKKHIKIDARLFVSTNKNLEQMVKEGKFRQDLFSRLNVLSIKLPSLKERHEDIPFLTNQILNKLCNNLSISNIPVVSDDAMKVLQQYDWPGNINELRNVLERTLMLIDNNKIEVSNLPLSSSGKNSWQYTVHFPSKSSLHDVTRRVARNLIIESLSRSSTKQEAAKLLGLSSHSLDHQIKILGL